MTRLQGLLKQLPGLQTEFPQTLTEFTVFPKLPPELRRKIWGIAAMEPRDIKIFKLEASGCDSRVYGQSIAPAIMNTSYEARIEGKRFYTLVNEKPLQKGDDTLTGDHGASGRARRNHSNKIWINFATDRLLFSKDIRLQNQVFLSLGDLNIRRRDLRKMKVLVIEDCGIDLRTDNFRSMPNIQEYVLVLQRKSPMSDEVGLGLEMGLNKGEADFKKRKGLSYQFKVEWLSDRFPY